MADLSKIHLNEQLACLQSSFLIDLDQNEINTSNQIYTLKMVDLAWVDLQVMKWSECWNLSTGKKFSLSEHLDDHFFTAFFWVVCIPDVLGLQIYLASFRQSQWEEICFPRKNLRQLDALLKRILALRSEGRSHLKKKYKYLGRRDVLTSLAFLQWGLELWTYTLSVRSVRFSILFMEDREICGFWPINLTSRLTGYCSWSRFELSKSCLVVAIFGTRIWMGRKS